MKCHLFGLCCMAAALINSSSNAAQPFPPGLPHPPSALTATPSVLALDDAGFDGADTLDSIDSGMHYYDANDGAIRAEFGGAVFPAEGGGYWLAGQHFGHVGASNILDAFIAKVNEDGSYDTSFGVQGQSVFAVPFALNYGVSGIVKDPTPASDRFYFTGPVVRAGGSDYDFAVYCTHSDGAPCAGFGVNGLFSQTLSTNNETPSRIRIDGDHHVIVMGQIDNNQGGATNLDTFVAELDGATGELVPTFGNQGVVYLAGLDLVPKGTDIPLDIVLTQASSPSGHRIYVVEASDGPNSTTVGRIIALNADTGAFDLSFNGSSIRALSANGYSIVAATTMIERADGNLVFAGVASHDNLNADLLLGEMDPSGSGVASFCSALGSGGQCIAQRIPNALEDPAVIAERPGTHDLVIALNINNPAGTPNVDQLQAVLQFGPTGNNLRAMQVLDYRAATGVPHDSNVGGLLIDAQGRVLVGGYRKWLEATTTATGDYDLTLARMIDTDTIFVSGFEQ
jgi:hypothetical protein